MEIPQQEASLISTLVTHAIAEDNLYKKVRVTNSILFALEEPIQKQIGVFEYHQRLKKIILDTDFLRKLKFNSVLKENPQSAVEYLGKDYLGGDENFKFDPDFEELLAQIKYDTEQVLGRVVNHLSKAKDGIAYEGMEV